MRGRGYGADKVLQRIRKDSTQRKATQDCSDPIWTAGNAGLNLPGLTSSGLSGYGSPAGKACHVRSATHTHTSITNLGAHITAAARSPAPQQSHGAAARAVHARACVRTVAEGEAGDACWLPQSSGNLWKAEWTAPQSGCCLWRQGGLDSRGQDKESGLKRGCS
eukprot:1148777-Pelagomonas_calceolata.AAC.1